jgi:hypothetical protein
MADNRDHPLHWNDDADIVFCRMVAIRTPIVASDGTQVGHVTHALGEPDRDIFDSLGFQHHLCSPPWMAPAAVVARITERVVPLTIPQRK